MSYIADHEEKRYTTLEKKINYKNTSQISASIHVVKEIRKK